MTALLFCVNNQIARLRIKLSVQRWCSKATYKYPFYLDLFKKKTTTEFPKVFKNYMQLRIIDTLFLSHGNLTSRSAAYNLNNFAEDVMLWA